MSLLPHNAADIAVMAAAALCASFVGAVAGSGGTAVYLPVIVFYLGVKDAIPVVTLANLFANASRVVFNWREIDRPVVAWFTLGSLPLSLGGAWLFTQAAPDLLTRLLGGFLIAMVVWRRLGFKALRVATPRAFGPLGAGFGFLNGFTEGVGPLMAPFFLAYGLAKGSYIGTDALATVFMQTAKLAVFGGADLLLPPILAMGFTLAPFMVAGAWLGKRMVERLSERAFATLVEAAMVLAGVGFLWGG